MLKSCATKKRRSSGSSWDPICADRLLDQVVEQLLHKSRVGFVARRQDKRPGRRTPLNFTASPERVSYDPVASIGLPFSSFRYRPRASKCSSVNPRGLIMPWHDRHDSGWV